MTLPLYQVDAFADAPFTGNPAAVCLCSDAPLQEARFQSIAAEMNLSETAFVLDRPGDDHFDLYWFTPTQEVDLCGHATLAAAHTLWDEQAATPGAAIAFHTRSGLLTARRDEKDDGWIQLDFPAEPVEHCDTPSSLAEALGATPVFARRNRMDVLALFDEAETVRGLSPDFARLHEVGRVGGADVRGIIATARAAPDADADFVSRFFAPGAGVAEDPVTGSAHCALAPFWAERLGKERLTGRQVSRRGGTVRCATKGKRVRLGGKAVTVLRGELLV